MADLFDLTGRVALVTGASQGLGRRFAEVLAARGAAVCLAARQTGKLAELAGELRARGGTCHAVALDVTDASAVSRAIADCETAVGPLDILVNNAGIAVSKPFLEQADDDWDSVVGTNLRGAFLVAREVAKGMAERGRGNIINVASVLGLDVVGSLSPYCASKGGLLQLTRAMAHELARSGVRVNAIAPGYIETDINRGFFESEAGRRLENALPVRRVGQPEELDGALLLLASDASRYMTGSTVTVDGGFLVR
ncbi:SDR family NAD(P)-dependent oxidoreductase [Algihabitans albus]|uniref:SDR family NAD(P)-dependent oxidoreductase n=1 Tax=Algihabitans albus TaxID=2164067 RepID=UPI000E5D0EB9|nr:glucose 1-dehydrogenase [Algihabitans albus]